MGHTQRVSLLSGTIVLLVSGVAIPVTPAQAAPLNRCAPTENVAPVLDSIAMSPQVVDARRASRQVQVTVEAHDLGGPGPRTGVRSIRLFLTNGRSFAMTYTGGRSWVGTTTVPRWSRGGPLAVRQAFLSDRADFPDRTPADDDGLFDVVYQPGGDHGVEVLSHRDDTLPRITDVDVRPRTVDTRRRARSVYLTARAFDGVSGVRDGKVVIYRNTASGGPDVVHLRPLAGRHGLLRGRLVVPRRAGTGAWDIQGVTIRDHAGRRRNLSAPDLLRAGWPHRLQVRSGPAVPAGRARVRSVTADADRVDVRTSDAAVTYEVRATNGAGVVEAVTFSFPFSAGIRAVPTPGLVSGDRHDGIWRTTVVVDSCLAQDAAVVPFVTAVDRSSSDGRNGPRLAVVSADNTNPTYHGFEVVDGRVVVSFSEDVDGVSTESVRVGHRASGEVAPGTWTCLAEGGGPTSCVTGGVRSATFTPDAALPAGEEYTLVVNPPGNLDVTDQNGNPAVRQTF